MRPLTRATAALAAAALTGSCLAGAAAAAPRDAVGDRGRSVPLPAATPAHGSERVTLLLRPRDRAALRRLATQRHARVPLGALQSALPDPDDRAAVVEAARGLGLDVVGGSRLTVELRGPAERVRAAFGSARASAAGSPVAQPLPLLPPSLRDLVSVAVGGDERRPAFHSTAATASGAALRQRYAGAAGGQPGRGVTVATVQLAGWDPRDLATYAASTQGPAPDVALVPDPVDPPAAVGPDSLEVSLDQEALYAVAPYARQRVYQSGNDLGGMVDSLVRIGDDALQGVDDHLVAASVSWGFCERALTGGGASPTAVTSLFASYEDALSYLAAVGVTVLVASGDEGTGCSTPDGGGRPRRQEPDVSYPASSPQVLAVGGTEGDPAGGAARAWSWTAAGGPTGQAGGSGGGSSAVFHRPVWQRPAVVGAGGGRALPDIAALAGRPGFAVLATTSPSGPARWRSAYGTSLAAPVAAAGLAVALSAAGHPYGLGAVGPDLYAAVPDDYATRGAPGLVDVTDPGDPGGPAAAAAPGWDRATGLGEPRWAALLGVLGGAPHLGLGTPGAPVGRYWRGRSDAVPWTAALSLAGARSADRTRLRVDVVTGTGPSCAVDYGSSPAGGTSTRAGTVDVTGGSYDPADPGATDGRYLLGLVERDGAGVCRTGQREVVVDHVPPAFTREPRIEPGAGPAPDLATWAARDEVSGVDHATVVVRRWHRGRLTTARAVRVQGSTLPLRLRSGDAYQVGVSVTDRAGNATGLHWSPRTTLLDDTGFRFSGGWSRVRSAQDLRGSARATARRGPSATATVTGRGYALLVRTGPRSGLLRVTVGGAPTTLDLYAPRPGYRVALGLRVGGRYGARRIVVTALGTRSRRSRGTTVVVDGLVATG